MLKITVVNNVDRVPVFVEETSTPRQVFTEAGIDYSRGMPQLDGATLRPGEMDRTFAELGIKDGCYLSSIVKADNA